MNEIVAQLQGLDDLKAWLDTCRLHYQQLRDDILTAEMKSALQEIDAEEQSETAPIKTAIAEQENSIKALVVQHGQTVKGKHLRAVFVQGRVSWDTKALDGYAVAHPEIETFRKVGNPSVRIENA